MGDRGNIVVRGDRGDVWLYSHNGGSELKNVLKTVLARKLRWDDASYLARMMFSEMISGDVLGELGFGISTHMCDNEHGILVVDVPKQKVVRIEETALENLRLPDTLDYRVSRSFSDYAIAGFAKVKRERRQSGGVLNDRRVRVQPYYCKGDRRSSQDRRKPKTRT